MNPIQNVRSLLVVAAVVLTTFGAACGGDSSGGGSSAPEWEEGNASATVTLDDGTVVAFEGGTCQLGKAATGADSVRIRVGEVGADGEGLLVGIALDLGGGATFPGDGSGNGVQVDHAGARWGLAEGQTAIVFDDDLAGGTIQIAGEATLGGDPDPRSGTVKFVC